MIDKYVVMILRFISMSIQLAIFVQVLMIISIYNSVEEDEGSQGLYYFSSLAGLALALILGNLNRCLKCRRKQIVTVSSILPYL